MNNSVDDQLSVRSPERGENRLARESSPYLLQHRHNPVDWRPWGDEAFDEARRRDVPVFLSIGYSTCYWCHVMERECFEDAEIAAKMNRDFVCVKVDREERPDVDDVYMAALLAFSGRGGWPMSLFLEPSGRRPFWAGTYFPAQQRPEFGVPSFPLVLERMAQAWKEQRGEVLEQARELGEAARQRVEHLGRARAIGVEQVQEAVGALLRLEDRKYGGFGGGSGGPKFPQPVFLELLLDVRDAASDEATRGAVDGVVRRALDAICSGGLNDHVGGGFHRYCVDARWIVPHFEKMLYDNAQLISVLARAAVEYGEKRYRRACERAVGYVLKEMTRYEGTRDEQAAGFFSAQDAEVDGKEGLNYLWTAEEIESVLGAEDGKFAIEVFGLIGGPNFRDPHHPKEPARNVLVMTGAEEELAGRLGIDLLEFERRLERIRENLMTVRSKRRQPAKDDKIIAAWNGLMIQGLARAGRVLGRGDWIERAAEAARWVLGNVRVPDGSLGRTWRDGRSEVSAVLEDYAAMMGAMAELAKSDEKGRGEWIERGLRLWRECQKQFAAGKIGGFYDTPTQRTDLFCRTSSANDGAMPTGISMLIHALIDLDEVVPGEGLRVAAVEALKSISGFLARSPLDAANSTRGLLRLMSRDAEFVRAAFEGLVAEEQEVDNIGTVSGLEVVEILSAADEVEISADRPAVLDLKLRVKEGYHINAAVPTPGRITSLIGLRVGVANGSGVNVYADYPEGEPYGPGGELRVHRGEVDLRVVLEREGEWSGQPVLVVTYQACTETECLSAMTVELDVAINRV